MAEALPAFNLKRILELRDKLITEVFFPRYDVTIEDDVFRSTVDDLIERLPRGIDRYTIYESARQLLGQVLTPELACKTAWRLAGNTERMQQGCISTPWSGQAVNEWVPVQCVRVEPGRNRREDYGAYLSLQVLAGSCCPMVLTRFWKAGLLQVLAPRLGFTKPWNRFPFQDMTQYVNLRFLVLIEPQRCTDVPGYFEVGCTSGCLKWNLEVLRRRFKIIPCPRNWTHDCHRCAVGFTECSAATHQLTYVKRFCAQCAQDTAFDPESPSLYCVHCTRRNALKRNAT